MAETATKGRELISSRIIEPPKYKVIFVNDDYTPMEFVIHLLVEIFNKNLEQAKDITVQIHEQGKGIAGTYNFEIAEQKVQESTMISRHNGHPLAVMMEKV